MEVPLLAGVIIISAVVVLILLVRTRRYQRTIAELREAARAQRENANNLSAQSSAAFLERNALIQTVYDPVIFVDNLRRITAMNAPARRLCNCEPGISLIEATRSYELDALAGDAIKGESELPREFILNSRLYRTHAAPVGKGALLVLHDVSELQRLGRARRDFVANISHELRTPLTALRLLIDTFRFSYPDMPPAQQRLLSQMNDQTEALTQLVQELSDLTQIESGQMPMRMVGASLHDAAETILSRLQPQADRAGLTLINNIDEDAYGLFDPEQIRRVLSNLMHNAIKFTAQGSVTVFTCDGEEATHAISRLNVDPAAPEINLEEVIVIGVRDTGAGIPKEELPRIFERFYKVDRARGHAGTGLGLAIAKHIVEAHGGRIWAESALSKGTTFYFTLPRDG
jgi:two-component system phosphate regulon sensor histidine kinase PhoR